MDNNTTRTDATGAAGTDSTEKPELKPCPFCGCEPDFLLDEDDCPYVMCSTCTFQHPAYRPGFEHMAIEAWNRRATVQPSPATGGELPKLDDDDEVVFPNDSGLAVIHESYYWKLRSYEEACAGGALDVEAERRAFETWLGRPMMNPEQPSHYNGRDVRKAWEAWQFRAATGTPAKSAPGEDERRDASRYQWLKKKHESLDEQWFVYGAKNLNLDSDIDAAMESPSNSPVGAKEPK